MENIELTPDSGSYKGTDWRMEGQLNEHLVAAAVFAYDVANITEPRIAFRQNTKLDERPWETLSKAPEMSSSSADTTLPFFQPE